MRLVATTLFGCVTYILVILCKLFFVEWFDEGEAQQLKW